MFRIPGFVDDKAERAKRKEWLELVKSAENTYAKVAEPEEVIEITVAEVLGIGSFIMPPESAVVRDTEGKVWLLEETRDQDGDLEGMVSRYDVEPGTKFRLRITKTIRATTKTYPLQPEKN
jgi:hypothetical protein